ncbi:MAG: serine/threonine protein kinase [Kiritimatiellae bacterium]|nr:serine/threonine protein kinase [Kiritimatiellia bacterium]
MLQEELTNDLRRLAAELDELGKSDDSQPLAFPPIADFEPISLLGCGGMGAVYVARQVSLGRDVAVKVVSENVADTPLPDEARTVAQLHHPNIVQVFSAGVVAGSAWFAMELVKGESADRHAFASVEEVAWLGASVAEALAYAHRCGILHRDVKPSNVFIGDDGRVKLGDFGLACLAAEGANDKSGTKRYMAPEVLKGGEATEASDQYSLGVTLRELARAQKTVPPDFDAILSRATAFSPSNRYDSVDALFADLRRFLAHEPVAANPPSPLRRFRLFARRNPLAAFGVVATAFLLAAFVAALAVGYVRTTHALAETEHARAETEKALAETEQEAAFAAQSLVFALTNIDRSQGDVRDAELKRACKAVCSLMVRFPSNETIRASQGRLKYAIEAHQRLKSRRGGNLRPPRNIPPRVAEP